MSIEVGAKGTAKLNARDEGSGEIIEGGGPTINVEVLGFAGQAKGSIKRNIPRPVRVKNTDTDEVLHVLEDQLSITKEPSEASAES